MEIRRSFLSLTAVAGFALLATLAGCSGNAPPSARSGAVPDSAAMAAALEIVPVTAEAVLDTIRASGARATLVNVWATWCIPCRKEFPDLVELRRRYHDLGFQLALVSLDDEAELDVMRRFMLEHGVDFRTYWKTGGDEAFINGMSPRWSGALPACFIYDHNGSLKSFWEGRATFEEMEDSLLVTLAPARPS